MRADWLASDRADSDLQTTATTMDLTTIPIDILYAVLAHCDYLEILHLRLVCIQAVRADLVLSPSLLGLETAERCLSEPCRTAGRLQKIKPSFTTWSLWMVHRRNGRDSGSQLET